MLSKEADSAGPSITPSQGYRRPSIRAPTEIQTNPARNVTTPKIVKAKRNVNARFHNEAAIATVGTTGTRWLGHGGLRLRCPERRPTPIQQLPKPDLEPGSDQGRTDGVDSSRPAAFGNGAHGRRPVTPPCHSASPRALHISTIDGAVRPCLRRCRQGWSEPTREPIQKRWVTGGSQVAQRQISLISLEPLTRILSRWR
jgi:hypothetical protein